MKKIIPISILLLIFSCTSDRPALPEDVEIIPVDMHAEASDLSSFVEKIELVPLETTDSSLLGGYRKVLYDKETDVYAIYDKYQVVHTFKGDGGFIASSANVQGDGPQEYRMALDMAFNPYRKGIDLLNPYGKVYTYSLDFDFISRQDLQPEFFWSSLMAVGEECYLFSIPSVWVDQEIALVDAASGRQDAMTYEGTLSSNNTMDKTFFYRDGDDFFFVPQGINYYFYQVDVDRKELKPVMYLDFGDEEIKESDLPGNATGDRNGKEGTGPDRKRDRLLQGMTERAQYIRDHGYIIPLIKFFNRRYVYIHFADGLRYGGNYVYDRERRCGYLQKGIPPKSLPPCFGIDGRTLLAIVDPYRLDQTVSRDLMSAEEIRKLENLDDEDNPVIIKYYLKE